MLHSTRSMPTTMATLHRLLGKSRLTRSGKVPSPTSVIYRAFSQRPSLLLTSKTLSADIPVVSGPTIDGFLVRSYATTTKKKPATKTKPATKKKTTTKKKAPAKKKAAAKKPKKVAKKKPVKKKVAKKPAKPTRPTVLAAPSARGLSGYVVYIQNHLKSTSGPGGPERLSEAVTQWRSLPDAEKQTWKARAESVNATRKQAYADFVSKLSPGEIKEENRKRRSLKRNFKSTSARTRLLKDPNAPKHPMSAYLRFFTETYEPGAVISEAAKAASARWKALSAAEKAPYTQAAAADRARFVREKAAYESS